MHAGPARCSRRRGSAATWPRAASCTWRCTPASTPERIYLHGNAKSRAELRDGARRRRRHDRARQRRGRAAAVRAARRPLAARAAAGHPRRRRRHPRGDPHGPGRLEVRLRARRRPRADRRPRPRASRSRACTCTWARSCSRSSPTGARSRLSARSATSGPTTSAAGSASPYTAGDPPLDVETWVAGDGRGRTCRARTGQRVVLEPGRALVANAGVTLYRVESVKRRR